MQPQSAQPSATILSEEWDAVTLHTPGDTRALLRSGGEDRKEGSSGLTLQK